MDSNLQSPSIESFSYSWLANLKSSTPPFEDSWIDDYASSFIEMDPRLPPSKRFIRVSSDFRDFDFPVSDSPLGLVDADELMSNGFVVPLFVRDMKMEHYAPSSGDTTSMSTNKSARWSNRVSLRRCRRVSKRFLSKYLFKFLLRPLFHRSWGRGCRQFERSISSGNNMATAAGRKWEFSAATSPRTSVAYSADDNWRRSCDSDSSIYEAVLHCKKTHQGK